MSEMMQVWIPLILSLLAMAGSGISWWQGRGKRRADEASVITGSAINLVQELQEQVAHQGEELKALRLLLQDEQEKRRQVEDRVTVLEKENNHLKWENRELRDENERLRGLQ